ncbi:MAG: hypothetical protein JWQ96_2057 [Segetibacter sp.]|nr:hypothetical protein [Segetibacter sp.]
MQVKIDTKEKFHVITLIEEKLAANIAAELSELVEKFLDEDVKNVVLKMTDVESIDENGAEELARLQQSFYEKNASFVICEVKPAIEEKLDQLELLEVMNITPTESEAWDIVQMEEIEREFLEDDDQQN